jgi:hypothetical protein
MSDLAISKAFEEASSKLGFSFVPHFMLSLAGGAAIHSLGLVQHFGRPNGTLIFGQTTPYPNIAQLEANGYFASILGSSYQTFDEVLFRETLDDWGFFGPAELQPFWYSGHPWC